MIINRLIHRWRQKRRLQDEKELAFVIYQIEELQKEIAQTRGIYTKCKEETASRTDATASFRHSARSEDLRHNYMLLAQYEDRRQKLERDLAT